MLLEGGGVLGALKLQGVAQPSNGTACRCWQLVGDRRIPFLTPRHEGWLAPTRCHVCVGTLDAFLRRGALLTIKTLSSEGNVVLPVATCFGRREVFHVVEGARTEPDDGTDALDGKSAQIADFHAK